MRCSWDGVNVDANAKQQQFPLRNIDHFAIVVNFVVVNHPCNGREQVFESDHKNCLVVPVSNDASNDEQARD